MTHAAAELASLAAKLPPSDRLELVETILATLDKPDPEISAAWAAEAQDRLAAYQRGELAAVDESEVFGDLGRSWRFAISPWRARKSAKPPTTTRRYPANCWCWRLGTNTVNPGIGGGGWAPLQKPRRWTK
jgi:putative addiction module component (TIGR02574 family)